ncbi:MAG TPA: ABC transporter permease [Gemmatimonadales bacterium]|nr:ABC transporter permease [Gemmatimonadales bacterium]
MRALLRDGRARFGLAVLLGMTLLAICAPLVSTIGPTEQRDVVVTRFLAPFTTDVHGVLHPLGTDRLGRDVWARLVHGARISLGVGALAILISTALGIGIGAIAGVWRGGIRAALLGLTDFALALPRVVLLLLLAALWRPSALLVVIVLGLTGWMSVARLVYAESRSLMARPFVDGALALGAAKGRVLTRHIVPNAVTPALVAAALGFGNAIMLEAGLSFLGIGVQPPAASWGSMIASGRDTLVNAPWVALAPGVALVLVVVAATLVGDAVQDWRGA